jgi:lantibiotic biosynthesis protein
MASGFFVLASSSCGPHCCPSTSSWPGRMASWPGPRCGTPSPVASPALDASIRHWLEDPDSDHGRRLERALVRYVTRMAANPTPFGLFAGCSTGTIGAGTTLTVASWAAGATPGSTSTTSSRAVGLQPSCAASLKDCLGTVGGVHSAVHVPQKSVHRTFGVSDALR